MIKYLHIVAPSKRMMEAFIKMTRENHTNAEHKFVFWDKCSKGDASLMDDYDNVVEIEGTTEKEKNKNLLIEFKNADVIIWHGIIFGGKRSLFLYLHPWVLKKSVWIMHGIDIYNWKREETNIKSVILNVINKAIRKKMQFIVSLTPEDEQVYRDTIKKQADIYFVPLPMSKTIFDEFNNIRNPIPRDNGLKYIQIANNSFSFNNHIMLLNKISRFKDNNFNIIVPLSYGNDWGNIKTDYKQQVINYAKNLFEDKVICLTRLMPPEEYADMLWNIDIGLFGAERQNALGNILRLLYFGAKVYLPETSPLYKYFIRNNIEVYKINDISKMSYDEFIKPCNDANKAVKWIVQYYHPDCSALRWQYLYESVAYKLHLTKEAPSLDKNELNTIAQIIIDVPVQKKKKIDYICLDKYTIQKKGTVMKLCKEVAIVGNGLFARNVFFNMIRDNMYQTRWFIKGIVSNYSNMFDTGEYKVGIIGTADEIRIREEDYISAIDDVYERENYCEVLQERGAHFINYAERGFNQKLINVGRGCFFGRKADIAADSIIGNHTYIFNATIGKGCVVGNYDTISDGVILHDNVKIGNNVVIGCNSIIYPNVIIPDGMIIASGSIIKESI